MCVSIEMVALSTAEVRLVALIAEQNMKVK